VETILALALNSHISLAKYVVKVHAYAIKNHHLFAKCVVKVHVFVKRRKSKSNYVMVKIVKFNT
jgi:hypothetical protein